MDILARKFQKRKTNTTARPIVATCVLFLIVGLIGSSVALANNKADAASNFGLDAATAQVVSASSSSTFADAETDTPSDQSILPEGSPRDISAGLATIDDEERAAEEARRAEEAAAIAQAEAARAQQEAARAQSAADTALSQLSDVDWSVGKGAFIAEWTARIDSYLAGSPLAGYGATFAEAAWANGVDPRFSPAIANTESSKGARCFKPYNAWGWMNTSSWTSWEEAINAHVAGLAAGYGYSLTYAGASKYCPGTETDWFYRTLSQMKAI